MLLLALYELFFFVVAIPYLLVIVYFLLHSLRHLGSVWAGYLLRILLLRLLLPHFDGHLSALLLSVVFSDPTKALIVILNLVYLHFPLSYLLFEIDRLLELLIHHIPLPFLSLILGFQVLVVI